MDNLENTGSFYGKLQVLERGEELDEEARLRAVNEPLLDWYHTHARVLPWREDSTPYRVWISEIMLQQTRVEAVKPYFERFIRELPDVKALAAAEDDRLMKLWQGLGYYSRVRNLKKAALVIMKDYGGEMPADYEALLKLPGIGSYTAGAIASIAFGQSTPAVDGNVLRVLSRLLGSHDDILKQSVKSRMEQLIRRTMPAGNAGSYTQGLIEIGAIICVPNGAPRCGECPLASVCLARKRGQIDEIPVKAALKKRKIVDLTVCILESEEDGRIAIHRRPDNGLLASLYELPNVAGTIPEEMLADAFHFDPAQAATVKPLPAAKHIFTHVEWRMTGYRVLLRGSLPETWIAVTRQELRDIYALPNAFRKYTELILEKKK